MRIQAAGVSVLTGVVLLCGTMMSVGCQKDDPESTDGLEPTPVRTSGGGDSTPAGQPETSATNEPVASFAGLTGPRPDSWIEEPPASSMRATQFRVPSEGDAGDAELAVFANIGGSNDANIARWVGQFTAEDGTGVEPELTALEADGMPVTVVSLSGTYSGMLPSGAPTEAAVNTGFLAAIVETPFTVLHLRLVGPAATVEANREHFMNLVKGLKSDTGD